MVGFPRLRVQSSAVPHGCPDSRIGSAAMKRNDREENLRALSREDVLEEHDEQFKEHAQETRQGEALFPGTRRRRFGLREASSTSGPPVVPSGKGHPQGIPEWPD